MILVQKVVDGNDALLRQRIIPTRVPVTYGVIMETFIKATNTPTTFTRVLKGKAHILESQSPVNLLSIEYYNCDAKPDEETLKASYMPQEVFYKRYPKIRRLDMHIASLKDLEQLKESDLMQVLSLERCPILLNSVSSQGFSAHATVGTSECSQCQQIIIQDIVKPGTTSERVYRQVVSSTKIAPKYPVLREVFSYHPHRVPSATLLTGQAILKHDNDAVNAAVVIYVNYTAPSASSFLPKEAFEKISLVKSFKNLIPNKTETVQSIFPPRSTAQSHNIQKLRDWRSAPYPKGKKQKEDEAVVEAAHIIQSLAWKDPSRTNTNDERN